MLRGAKESHLVETELKKSNIKTFTSIKFRSQLYVRKIHKIQNKQIVLPLKYITLYANDSQESCNKNLQKYYVLQLDSDMQCGFKNHIPVLIFKSMFL